MVSKMAVCPSDGLAQYNPFQFHTHALTNWVDKGEIFFEFKILFTWFIIFSSINLKK